MQLREWASEVWSYWGPRIGTALAVVVLFALWVLALDCSIRRTEPTRFDDRAIERTNDAG